MNAPTQSQIRDALWSMPPNTFLLDSDVSAWFRLNSDTIRDVLQSALDTQKPAGDAAEALDWFNGILDVFHSKYEATEPDKEAEHISTICAALAGKPKDGGDLFTDAYEHACRDAALCLGMSPADPPKSLKHAIGLIRGPNDLPQKQSIYATFARYFEKAREKALTADNAKRGSE